MMSDDLSWQQHRLGAHRPPFNQRPVGTRHLPPPYASRDRSPVEIEIGLGESRSNAQEVEEMRKQMRRRFVAGDPEVLAAYERLVLELSRGA